MSNEVKSGVLTQISKRSGRIERVRPEHAPPTIELYLEPGQYVTGVELKEEYAYRDRKTTDWFWTAYVVTPLGDGSEA